MSPYDWQEIIGVVGVFVLITAVTTVLIWQLAATWRAKAALARENEYRALAERAVQAQESWSASSTSCRSGCGRSNASSRKSSRGSAGPASGNSAAQRKKRLSPEGEFW
ncbi:hypothetical protein ACVDFE_27505 [Lentzea chajnantorensis]